MFLISFPPLFLGFQNKEKKCRLSALPSTFFFFFSTTQVSLFSDKSFMMPFGSSYIQIIRFFFSKKNFVAKKNFSFYFPFFFWVSKIRKTSIDKERTLCLCGGFLFYYPSFPLRCQAFYDAFL